MASRIGTSEIDESPKSKSGRTKSGKVGGKARAATLTKNNRLDIAKKAAKKRWE